MYVLFAAGGREGAEHSDSGRHSAQQQLGRVCFIRHPHRPGHRSAGADRTPVFFILRVGFRGLCRVEVRGVHPRNALQAPCLRHSHVWGFTEEDVMDTCTEMLASNTLIRMGLHASHDQSCSQCNAPLQAPLLAEKAPAAKLIECGRCVSE